MTKQTFGNKIGEDKGYGKLPSEEIQRRVKELMSKGLSYSQAYALVVSSNDNKMATGGGVGDEAKNWFSVKFKLPDGRISWTTTYSSMGEKYAKKEVLEDFAASEIIEIRKATKNEIDDEMNSKYANGGGVKGGEVTGTSFIYNIGGLNF